MIPRQLDAGRTTNETVDPLHPVYVGDLVTGTESGVRHWQEWPGTRAEFVANFLGTSQSTHIPTNPPTPGQVSVEIGGTWEVEVSGPVAIDDYLGPVATSGGRPGNAGFVLEVVSDSSEATHQATIGFNGPGNGTITANQRNGS